MGRERKTLCLEDVWKGRIMKYPEDYINKIICGDCLEVMKGIPDKSIDLIVTSPPYGVGKEYEENQSFEDLIKCLDGFISQSYRVLKDNGNLFVNFQDPFVRRYHIGKDYYDFATKVGFEFSGNRIWKKDPAWMNSPWISGSNYPVLEWEYIWTFSKGKRPFKKEFAKITNRGIWELASIRKFTNHPAEYPDGLPMLPIQIYTEKGDVVLDPFSGSGTTCVVAKEFGRNFIGIEQNQQYCEIAQRRLAQEYLFS